MEGFLLGDRYNIPRHINDLFQMAGVVHILAISGFNVGIVAYVIFLFLKMFPLGRRWHYILTILILIVYAVLTGGQPPVVRATIMAVVFSWFYPGARAGIRQHAGLRGAAYSPRESGEPL